MKTCKHCGEEIHIMHPLGLVDGRMTWAWSHEGRGSLCIVDGKFTGYRAEPETCGRSALESAHE